MAVPALEEAGPEAVNVEKGAVVEPAQLPAVQAKDPGFHEISRGPAVPQVDGFAVLGQVGHGLAVLVKQAGFHGDPPAFSRYP